jgi:hypothetical protein
MNKNVDQVYIKRGRKYTPLGPYEWHGFPADGVWLVQVRPGHKSEELILKLGDLQELYPFAQMMVSKDDLVKVILGVTAKQHSVNDIAIAVIKWLAEGGKSDESSKR